jgi:hypothetical protein
VQATVTRRTLHSATYDVTWLVVALHFSQKSLCCLVATPQIIANKTFRLS